MLSTATKNPLGLPGRLTLTSWTPPADWTEANWRKAGVLLGNVERSVSWWIGDWWAFGETKYGERKAVVEADGWEGPTFQTCANAASVCRAFKPSRRRELLSFTHHAEVAGLPPAEADKLLNWCEETIAETGKPRSTRALRDEVSCRKAQQREILARMSVAEHTPARPAQTVRVHTPAGDPAPAKWVRTLASPTSQSGRILSQANLDAMHEKHAADKLEYALLADLAHALRRLKPSATVELGAEAFAVAADLAARVNEGRVRARRN
jgi:hypothetical protein